MDRLAHYRQLIRALLQDYAQYHPADGSVDLEVIIDQERDHYQLMCVGWQQRQRVHGSMLHLDIRDGKIWIQHDGTEEGVANRLVAAGVPHHDIVLGFHSPYKRQFTDFAPG